jgi:N-acetylglucosaminyldiphosphoundecaprenol N-acetyl-beta-D-mannosaminyltransferase
VEGVVTLKAVTLQGIRVHAMTEAECVQHVLGELAAHRGGWVATLNVHYLRRLVGDPSFRTTCAPVNLAVADGMPLVWAGRLQGTPFPERVTGASLVCSLAAAAAVAGRSLYLLGGASGVARAAADVLQRRHSAIRIAGTLALPPDFEPDEGTLRPVADALALASPDIVYVALGSPKQDRVIARLRATLPHTWWLGIGVALSFLTGDIPRAPEWMQEAGLEWFHRLATEPRRLARRYLVDDLPFAASLLLGAAVSRVAGFALLRRSPGQ